MQDKPFRHTALLSSEACFEALGCSVAELEQQLVVSDSASTTRYLHDDEQ